MAMTPPALESHSARYFAVLYSPPAQHAALEALFGIEREVFESLKPGLDHHVAHSRLQWWREECERAVGGKAVHPLTRALVDALGPHAGAPSAPMSRAAGAPSLPGLAGLSGLVDVAVWDLASATFDTRRELTAYCERWAAAIFETVGGSFSIPSSVGTPAPSSVAPGSEWRSIGAAVREIELLSDLAREAHYGRIRLPLDELDHVKVEPGVLAKPPWPEAIADILRARHRVLRAEITRGLANVDRDRQAALRGLLVWAALACRMSQRAERALPDRLRPGRFDAISDAWFAWGVARKATSGRFRPS
jgi:15-cis-phytoene synthase